MSTEIIKPGLLTTLVGCERKGFRNIGIGSGGAMDRVAMRVANYLVGNNDNAAVMELHLPAPEILFKQSYLVSITGKGFEVLVNGVAVPRWRPIRVTKNAAMSFDIKSSGGRGYLSVKGGWRAQDWLGSFSTHLGVQMGGYVGRALRKGDLLEAEEESGGEKDGIKFPWAISENELDRIYFPPNEIRCVKSIETDLLSNESKEIVTSQFFTITHQSNRMGYRLAGEPLYLSQRMDMASSPVDFGTIQLLPDGNLIILMADHQTAGGYPRIGSVIKADLPKLAQLGVNGKVAFKMISLAEAELLLLSMEKQLDEIKSSCLQQISRYSIK